MTKLFPPPPVGLMRPSDTGPTLKIADGKSDFINSFLLQAEPETSNRVSGSASLWAIEHPENPAPCQKPLFPVFHSVDFHAHAWYSFCIDSNRKG